MDSKDYIYSTAEIAKYYGLTRKGLAFYEVKGIISPSRTENNKYRVFSLQDCYNLYHTKLFANCGCSLAETADLLQCCNMKELISRMNQKHDQMRREFLLKERILLHADRLITTLKKAENTPFFEIVSSPDFYRLFVRYFHNEHIFSKEASEEFEAWNHMIPVNTASLKYSAAELTSGCEELNVCIGNMMPAEDFRLFHFEKTDRVEHIAPVKSLHTILIGNGDEICRRQWLEPALRYLNDHHFTLAGDPFTSMLAVMETPDGTAGRIRYDEAWFPID